MKTNKQWITAMCVFALAGCASEPMDSTSTNSYSQSSTTPAASTTMTSSTASPPPTTSMAQASSGVVQAIDQMQRQDVGVGVMGAAAAGGNVGMPTDKVYRVTVRLDDGSSQMVVVESMPSYKIGDRVRYADGAVTTY